MAEEGDKNKQESLIFRGCSVLTSYRSCLVWWRHDTERIRGCLRLIKLGFIFRCPSSQYLAQAVMQIPITCCIMSLCNQPTLLLRKSGILSIKKFQLAHSITAYIMGYVYLFDTKQPYLHISMLEYESIIEKLYNLCNTLYNNCTEVLHIGHAAGPL